MVKAFILSFFIFLSACAKKTYIYQADLAMYPEYFEFLKAVSNGKLSVNATFNFDSNYQHFYREFNDLNTRILFVFDKRLRQQYIIIYSNFGEKNLQKLYNAPGVSAGHGRAKFNAEIYSIYLKIEEVTAFRFEKDVKKVFIGFETGGALANIFAQSLIGTPGFNAEDIEVISFGSPPFSKNFRPKFYSVAVNLISDAMPTMQTSCCAPLIYTEERKIRAARQLKGGNKLDVYRDSIKNETLQRGDI